jgi:2-oxoglutarate dehydrogenase E1 component
VDLVLGMAHRGRLNVLANILGKSAAQIFREFEDPDPTINLGSGDVKYHKGYSADWKTAAGTNVHLSLCFNPSHLEFVNPVAMGRVRARQDRLEDAERSRVMNLLIHGDASMAGEGIVQESLNMSELPPYQVGGTLHVVLNNQIGFTTGPDEGRSSTYCTDVCKMLQIPIFHVNGENPEAVAQAIHLAMDFRKQFDRDVVIDMYCYRRHGHNETDEPSFTQPKLYEAIRNRPSVRESDLQHLLELGGVSREEADRIAEQRRQRLEAAFSEAQEGNGDPDEEHIPTTSMGTWNAFFGGPASEADTVDTSVPKERLGNLLERGSQLPEGFSLHRKLKRLLDHRLEMARAERALDWAAGEWLALATLATEGARVRLTGQDSERGTFSHRHAVLHDVETAEAYEPLRHLAPDQADVEIRNSPLSESGVMGFEYGYSLDCPEGLVAWEAQFGDFVNAGQVIVDQFLTSAEDKWRRLSGLVLLLPHGFEGTGPEHASARLERFLTQAAEDHIQIAQPTAPAQYFHLLRRQVLRRWRKPLVVLTPKSLLRHPRVKCSLEDLAEGAFHCVLPDRRENPGGTERVLLCTGKISYELEQRREELGRDEVAILRLEQLYPFPEQALAEALGAYRDETPVYWVQEEPANMGAWPRLREWYCGRLLGRFPLAGVSRPASASPATGSHSSHAYEQEQILVDAFGGEPVGD